MSERTGRALVTGSMLAVAAILVARRNEVADPFRNAFALAVLWLGLSLLADISPEVAGPFAILVAFYAWNELGSGHGLLPGQAAKAKAGAQAAGAKAFTSIPSS